MTRKLHPAPGRIGGFCGPDIESLELLWAALNMENRCLVAVRDLHPYAIDWN